MNDAVMPTRRTALWIAAALPAAGCSMPPRVDGVARAELIAQARAAETAFAQTMARRDLAGFASYLADDAVFINGGNPLRGKDAIVAHWSRFFAGPDAPFSWSPEIVEVAATRALAYTEGPVLDPAGVAFARFFSTWQRDDRGSWRIVFDNGTPLRRT